MKKLILSIILLLLTVGCSTIKYVPVKGDTVVEYRYTTIWKDSLIYIPKETIKEVVPYMEPLQMETSLATAKAWLDTTTTTLKGTLTNKKGIVEKVKWREKIVYRDSVVTHEIPVEVEVEKIVKTHFWYEKILWALSLLAGVMIGRKLYPIVKKWLTIL